MSMDSVANVLLVFGNQAKEICVDHGASIAMIRREFSQVFTGQINVLGKNILQKWDDKWDQWVDVSEEGVVVQKSKFRLVELENRTPKLGNLDPETCAFLCCDMQERFKPAIKYFNEIATVANRLLSGAFSLDIPVVVTEQYPKGLLHTVAELDISKACAVVPKTLFSMMIPPVVDKLNEVRPNLQSVILFGVEAHVCIQQTALDLLSRGIEVHVIADACSSRNQVDRLLAFQRLRNHGALITTAETVLLQLVKDKDHPKFKEIQGIIKVLPPDSGLQLQSHI